MTIEAITFDFGNTLVPVPAAGLRGVVAISADRIAAQLGPFDRDEVLHAWAEERERQFREEVPQFREVDLAERVVRILARLRGMPVPLPDGRWDDRAAAAFSTPEEVAWAVDVYSRAFVASLPPAPAAGALLALLILTSAAPTASARPDPGDAGPSSVVLEPSNCPLRRIDTHLVRCDNHTGAGVAAPLWIPELVPLVTPVTH